MVDGVVVASAAPVVVDAGSVDAGPVDGVDVVVSGAVVKALDVATAGDDVEVDAPSDEQAATRIAPAARRIASLRMH